MLQAIRTERDVLGMLTKHMYVWMISYNYDAIFIFHFLQKCIKAGLVS